MLNRELNRRKPAKRPHGKVVGTAIMDAKLLGTIIERVKNIAGIEAFLVLTMAAFHLAVVPGSIGTDEFVTNTQALRSRFKQSGYIPPAVERTVGTLMSLVRPNTFNLNAPASVPFH